MASNLKGKGAFSAVNTVVVAYDKSVHTNEKTGATTQWLDVQVDARDARGKGDTNLHLYSDRQVVDGRTRFNNGAAYSAGQFDIIKEAAGQNTAPIYNKAGNERIGTLYAVKADLTKASDGNGLIINTKADKEGEIHVGPSDFETEPDTLANQFLAMKEARDARAAAKSAPQASAPEVAQPQQTVEAELEPQVG